jgi:hypothetical protein
LVTGTKVTQPRVMRSAPAVQFGQHALDAQHAGHLVAMHGAQHQQARARAQAVELVHAQAGGGRRGRSSAAVLRPRA